MYSRGLRLGGVSASFLLSMKGCGGWVEGIEADVAAVLAVLEDGITPSVFEHGRLVLSRVEPLNKTCLQVYSMY